MRKVEWKFVDDGKAAKRLGTTKEFHDEYKELFDGLTQEEFYVFFMDVTNVCIGYEQVAKGILASVWTHSREVFRSAIVSSCHHVVVAHNHPSGSVELNQDDYDLTKSLVLSGKLLGIQVLDSVVFGNDSYFSFVEHGIIEDILREDEEKKDKDSKA